MRLITPRHFVPKWIIILHYIAQINLGNKFRRRFILIKLFQNLKRIMIMHRFNSVRLPLIIHQLSVFILLRAVTRRILSRQITMIRVRPPPHHVLP